MPQFEMNGKYESAFKALDYFTQAYIEAMFWTSEAPGVSTEEWQATEDHNEGSIPGDVGFDDLAPGTLEMIKTACAKFQDENRDDLEEAYTKFHSNGNAYDEASAGHDFWLTRNHHGVGFWDRGLGELGDRLTKASHGYGEVDCYLGDDDLVYVM